jgi:hypothetical protein
MNILPMFGISYLELLARKILGYLHNLQGLMRVCRIPVKYSIRHFTVLLWVYEGRALFVKTEMSLQVSLRADKTGIVLVP